MCILPRVIVRRVIGHIVFKGSNQRASLSSPMLKHHPGVKLYV